MKKEDNNWYMFFRGPVLPDGSGLPYHFDPEKLTVNVYLKFWRNNKGWTIKELAGKTESITEAMIGQYESKASSSKATLDQLNQLADLMTHQEKRDLFSVFLKDKSYCPSWFSELVLELRRELRNTH